ncbi:TCR gamma alternate reading frame protein isoform X2 [Oxyura jamaicensis]|uniref:TCR gamma alternate reading frame protein isoform X2 n=1 Tax=Oxyura jamaicensis TaxID=8884 RepID=UPI0015A68F6D|nr:TCR gamma alternate reading frame protein isoform X2 [Oxyura jamaicensis]
MWLLRAFVLAAAFSCSPARALQQSSVSITKPESKTVLITCHISIPDFDKAFIHWYRKRPGAAPERVAYMASRLFLENEADGGKFSIEKDLDKSVCTLTVSKVTQQDAATYYCARWDADVKIFGSGTKLIVSDKGNSKPDSSEILQTKHKDQLLYVCLIENFYPEVIRVQWVDEADKEVTENVVKGDIWKSTNDKYSISTWLTLPANTTNKNYYCKYEHESQENFKLHIHDSSETPSQEEYCSKYSGNSTVFYKDYLMHRAAHLVYLVLLLKSSMYYVIVLFFIYRTRTPAKLPGKKT